jgi:zinc transporter 9
MLGLLVHAVVDGIALGAMAHTGGTEGSMLVFMAIMLHKAPATFGLATYLLQLGDQPRAVKQQLLIFSSAAPVCT